MPDPALILQAFFILSASTVILLNSFPAVRTRYIAYGSRAIPVKSRDKLSSHHETDTSSEKPDASTSKTLIWLLERLDAIQVPHRWFRHFYIISVFSSLFWGVQILAKGSVLQSLCQSAASNVQSKGMTVDQVVLTWSLVTAQGVRRLLETSFLVTSSGSKMWFVHWLLGIAFYLALGVSCWIEGAGMWHHTPTQVEKR
ncbi:3-oxo-5-alpha-steroid 4-dehydrogenase [Imshaugia aleurites]|uniref:Polyprenal reductase n=1 Tax=Imshaugia aleurites TaxID=172621 RepID=A0A8H3F1D2_9LECA|nr:3-oxo-5-alpha-steroid 4-dehydrogenase [Imshaugia aleurites]